MGPAGGPVRVHGAVDLEGTTDGVLPHRLPARARRALPPLVHLVEQQPAGVRLALRTAGRRLELEVRARRTVVPGRGGDAPAPAAGPVAGAAADVPAGGRYDAEVDGVVVASAGADAAGVVEVDFAAGTVALGPAPLGRVVLDGLPAGEKDVVVWLPYSEVTHLVALHADAPVHPPRTPPGPRWLHHGSSVSQGTAAASPSGTWVATAARRLGLDVVNVGLGGQAQLQPAVADALAGQPAEVVSLELGINLVTHDVLRRPDLPGALHRFLDAVRGGHPGTPVVVVSPLLWPLLEDVPGPVSTDPASPPHAPVLRTTGRAADVASGRLTVGLVRDALAAVVAERRDPHLHLVDGRTLFGPADWADAPMPDRVHPDAEGHRRIGERFADVLASLVPASLVPAREGGARGGGVCGGGMCGGGAR